MAPRTRSAHQRVAERALGKPLPAGAEIHHVNGDPKDNRPANLVICQDAAYHDLLHARARARGWTPVRTGEVPYILRDVNDELWKRVKVKAAQDGKPIRTVLIELLTKYAK